MDFGRFFNLRELYLLGSICVTLILPIFSGLLNCKPFDIIVPTVCSRKRAENIPGFDRTPDHVVLIHATEKPCVGMFQCCSVIGEVLKYHVNELGWLDIGFNFLIGNDGRVYVGRGWNKVGRFSHQHNEDSLSVAFMGGHLNHPRDDKILEVAKDLVECMVNIGYLMPNYTLHMHEDIECNLHPIEAIKRTVKEWPHYRGRAENYINC